MVEFALLLPILVLLIVGIMEFGRFFEGYLELQNAARDGARYAAIHQTKSESSGEPVIDDYTKFENRVKSRLTLLDSTKISIDLDYVKGSSSGEYLAEVNLNYQMDMVTPLIGAITGDPVEIKADMAMRSE